jgi:hypothetical protein
MRNICMNLRSFSREQFQFRLWLDEFYFWAVDWGFRNDTSKTLDLEQG